MEYAFFLLALLFMLTVVYTIMYYVWEDRYGPIQAILSFHTYNVPVRSRMENWRDKLRFIDLIAVNMIITDFFRKNRQYNDKEVLESLELCFVNSLNVDKRVVPSGKANGMLRNEIRFAEFKRKYVIVVNIQTALNDRWSNKTFAELLIHEYKHAYINHKYGHGDPDHLRKEWET